MAEIACLPFISSLIADETGQGPEIQYNVLALCNPGNRSNAHPAINIQKMIFSRAWRHEYGVKGTSRLKEM